MDPDPEWFVGTDSQPEIIPLIIAQHPVPLITAVVLWSYQFNRQIYRAPGYDRNGERNNRISAEIIPACEYEGILRRPGASACIEQAPNLLKCFAR